jgi:hypothetical protein
LRHLYNVTAAAAAVYQFGMYSAATVAQGAAVEQDAVVTVKGRREMTPVLCIAPPVEQDNVAAAAAAVCRHICVNCLN